MFKILASLNCDGYKTSHYKQFSPHTEKVYSTWTPRKSRLDGVNEVVFFGLQYFIKDYLIDSFNETFFNRPKDEVIAEIKRVMKQYSGDDNTSHWEALHDLGYLPLKIDALKEGTLCPIRVPMFTIENTLPEFYWLTNFVETVMSTEIWKPMTSATIALQYKKILDKWADKTCDNNEHVKFQGHDFSYRGMAGTDAGCSSGAGHLLSFVGTDTIPAILWLEQFYKADCEKELVGCSIPATEHAVAETNIIEIQDILENQNAVQIHNALADNNILIPDGMSEKCEAMGADETRRMLAETFYLDRLLNVYKSGIFSYVADTYNLWEVLTSVMPMLKNKIMERDGKIVVRPDSGDPVDIICGLNSKEGYIFEDNVLKQKTGTKLVSQNACTWEEDVYEVCDMQYSVEQAKGVVELLWDTFGGTINEKGYKVLDSHVGVIYGDAITLERAEDICRRLEQKGFASSSIVLGIGSYTYNMNTRDTFGFALKATYGVVDGKELMLYKDPITDDGTKKSQRGMVSVFRDERFDDIMYKDGYTKEDKARTIPDPNNEWGEMLLPVFENGKLLRDQSLSEIRERLVSQPKRVACGV